jgi:hypothetical protein
MKKNYIATLNDRIIQDAMSAKELMLVRGGQTVNVGCSANDGCPINFKCDKDNVCIDNVCPNHNCGDSCKNKRCSSDQFCGEVEINSIGNC